MYLSRVSGQYSAPTSNLIWALHKSLYGAPARQPAPPATLSMLFLTMCLIYFETLPVGDRGNQKLCTVGLCKIENLGTNIDFAVSKIVWQIV
jgi:hypothetical protein